MYVKYVEVRLVYNKKNYFYACLFVYVACSKSVLLLISYLAYYGYCSFFAEGASHNIIQLRHNNKKFLLGGFGAASCRTVGLLTLSPKI